MSKKTYTLQALNEWLLRRDCGAMIDLSFDITQIIDLPQGRTSEVTVHYHKTGFVPELIRDMAIYRDSQHLRYTNVRNISGVYVMPFDF